MATAWRPNIRETPPSLERLAQLSNSAFQKIKDSVSNKLSLQIYITNGTPQTLRFVNKNVSNSTQCDVQNGWELKPNHARSVRLSDNQQLRVTISFSLGREQLCINAHVSKSGMKCFSIRFQEVEKSPHSVFRVVSGMPDFMGFGSSSNQVCSSDFVASVLHVYEDRSQIHIYLGNSSEASSLESFHAFLNSDSWQQLEFAESCAQHDEHRNLLGNVLFLAEFSAVEKGLPGTCLEDQLFALDLLVATFVVTGILNISDENLEASLHAWKSTSGAPPSRASNQPDYAEYCRWAAQKGLQVEKHIEDSRMLLLTAGRVCAFNVSQALTSWKVYGRFDEGRMDTPSDLSDSGLHSVASAAADAIRAIQQPDKDELALIKRLVIDGISQADKYAQRRESLIAVLEQGPHSAAVQYYYKCLPLTARLFISAKDNGRIEMFSPEVFGDLDSSQPTDPRTVFQSLRSEAYLEDMKTNSMSGELFYHSTDDVFMVKTISQPEGKLLRKMAPSYKAHVQSEPRSFMCRYAGLFRIEAPGVRSRYFVIMRSVFDPGMKEGMKVFDLKGTLVNRKKAEGQSCGKDQDWVDEGCRIRMPRSVRSEVCAVHARDVSFLLRFGVMDYSMLVGCAVCRAGEATRASGWRPGEGLLSMKDNTVHYMGLIDHLVEYDLLRDFQNLLEGDQAEIVPPDRYAARQIEWFRENAVENLDPAEDCGTVGRLKVNNIKGFVIRGLQENHSSDQAPSSTPSCLGGAVVKAKAKLASLLHRRITTDTYVVVTVGLRSAKTEVQKQTANPVFAGMLYLPIDAVSEDENVLVEVWQAVTGMLHGDRLVGKLSVPLQQLLNAPRIPHVVKKSKLRSIQSLGRMSLELMFEPSMVAMDTEAHAGQHREAATQAVPPRPVRAQEVTRAKTTITALPEGCAIS